LILAGILLMAFASGCGREPTAKGRSLEQWIDVLKQSRSADELKSAAQAIAILGKQAEAAAPDVIRLLDNPDALREFRGLSPAEIDAVTEELAKALRSLGSAAVPTIVETLRYRDHTYSGNVVDALPDETIPPLVEALDHADVKVRLQVARLLGQMGPRATEATDKVTGLLNDEHPGVREQAIDALAGIKPDSAPVEPLIDRLDDEKPVVRERAARALGILGQEGEKAVPALIETLDDSERWVHLAAVRALASFPGHSRRIVKVLTRRMDRQTDPEIRGGYLKTMAVLGEDSRSGTDSLVDMLRDRDTMVVAAQSLQKTGELAQAPPELLVLLMEPDSDLLEPEKQLGITPELADAVTEALAGMGEQAAPAIPGILRSLGSDEGGGPDRRRKVILAIGSQAVGPLTEMLTCRRDRGVAYELDARGMAARAEAARLLGELGSAAKPALDELKKATSDPSGDVRSAAARAIAQIKAEG
jgi:HEAT repeat protein